MTKGIQLANLRIECGRDGCGFVLRVDVPERSHVGMKCPRCGVVLVTESDYEEMVEIYGLIDGMNDMLDSVNKTCQ